MTSTESDRILAAGVPLELAGGEARLRFDWLAYHKLEHKYGSIAAAGETLARVCQRSVDEWNEPLIDDLVEILAIGTRMTVDELLEAMPYGDMGLAVPKMAYACLEAWNQAFPQPRAEGKDDDGTTGPTASPGPTPTGSSPESPVAATATSGA